MITEQTFLVEASKFSNFKASGKSPRRDAVIVFVSVYSNDFFLILKANVTCL